MEINKGSRVRAFDTRLYKDDVSTPLSVTMKEATVIRIYLEYLRLNDSRKLADIKFDHRPEISKGHFVSMLEGQIP